MEDLVPLSSYNALNKLEDSTHKENYKDYRVRMDSVKSWLYDSIFIKIYSTNIENDTVFGWPHSGACYSKYKRLNNEAWNYGLIHTCFYWSNITPFIFFKYPIAIYTDISNLGVYNYQEIEDFPLEEYTDLEIVATVNFRIFHYSNVDLYYDGRYQSIRMKYH